MTERSSRVVGRHPDDHVAVALAGPAQRPQAVEDLRLQPDQSLPLFVGRVLISHRAQLHGRRDGVEGGLGDGDLDHATPRLIGATLSAISPAPAQATGRSLLASAADHGCVPAPRRSHAPRRSGADLVAPSRPRLTQRDNVGGFGTGDELRPRKGVGPCPDLSKLQPPEVSDFGRRFNNGQRAGQKFPHLPLWGPAAVARPARHGGRLKGSPPIGAKKQAVGVRRQAKPSQAQQCSFTRRKDHHQ